MHLQSSVHCCRTNELTDKYKSHPKPNQTNSLFYILYILTNAAKNVPNEACCRCVHNTVSNQFKYYEIATREKIEQSPLALLSNFLSISCQFVVCFMTRFLEDLRDFYFYFCFYWSQIYALCFLMFLCSFRGSIVRESHWFLT